MEAGATPAVTINLTPPELEALNQLAALRGTSPAFVLREALLEKKFLADKRRAGHQIVIRDQDGKLTPIQWAYEY